jgi:hypothetical protein
MRSFLLIFLLSVACSLHAQHHLELHLSQRLGTQPFALNTVTTSSAGTSFKVTRLQYYLSGINITHDGGQITPMTDVYLLVNPALDSVYQLGEFPGIETVEAIEFSIGVDQAHNHLDPAQYDPGHPLAPQNPSMHWGWSPGYRFIALEGKAGTNFNQIFEVHTVGDANYRTVNLPTMAETTSSGLTIHLVADYANIVKGINVGTGPIVHGSSGAAVTLANNMKNEIFSSPAMSSVLDPLFTGTFRLSPNPAVAGRAQASFELLSGSEYQITLTDCTGRFVSRQQVAPNQQVQAFDAALSPGAYYVHLWQDGRPVVVEKLIVVQ